MMTKKSAPPTSAFIVVVAAASYGSPPPAPRELRHISPPELEAEDTNNIAYVKYNAELLQSAWRDGPNNPKS